MGSGQRKNNYVVQEAAQALHNLKYEVSQEINIDTSPIVGDYWGNMTSRDCGAVGGHMVKRMIEAAERSVADQQQAGYSQQPSFQANASANAYAAQQPQQMQQQQQQQQQQPQQPQAMQPDKVAPNSALNLGSLDQLY